MIIYLLTFYLFVDIKIIFRITHAKNSAASKSILLTFTKMHVNLNVYIFYLRFVLGFIHGDRCDRKIPKLIILFKENPFFWSLN